MFIVLVAKDNQIIVLLFSSLEISDGPAVPEWAGVDRHLFPAKKSLEAKQLSDYLSQLKQ